MNVIHGSLIPATTNTPIDARCRVETESDILNIENPYIGQLIYCIDSGKFYVINTLASKKIGPLSVDNAAVGTYTELTTGGSIPELDKEALFNEFEDRILKAAWGFNEEEKAALIDDIGDQLLNKEYGEVIA